MATIENDEGKMVSVRVGDFVCFKAGRELSGIVKAIRGNNLAIVVTDDFEEERTYTVYTGRCWLE